MLSDVIGPAVLVTLLVIVGIAITGLYLLASIAIVRKAGYSGWWILVTFVPVIGWIMFFVFAFGRWPIYQLLPAPARWRSAHRCPRTRPRCPGWDHDAGLRRLCVVPRARARHARARHGWRIEPSLGTGARGHLWELG